MGVKKSRPAKPRGISWHKNDRRWRAQIRSKSKCYDLGNYKDPQIAARVYDCAAVILHGPDAKLNFDGQPPPTIPRSRIVQMLVRKGAIKH